MKRIEPSGVRYIKLGAGGAWEEPCFQENRVYWGDNTDPHELALAGDWQAAHECYLQQGYAQGTSTGYVRQLRDFYSLGEDCLWITFAQGHLWWAFADPKITMLDSPSGDGRTRFRKTLGPWRNTDIRGRALPNARLSSSLTQLAGYRQTICSVKAQDYLLRQLNDDPDPLVQNVRTRQAELVDAVATLIRQLHRSDFEVLVDLLLARIGWRRTSRLGGTLKDVDLVAVLPATGERADVQVKSSADQATINACYEAFKKSGAAGRFIFTCHSPQGNLARPESDNERFELWDPARIAARAIDEGLVDWLVDRSG